MDKKDVGQDIIVNAPVVESETDVPPVKVTIEQRVNELERSTKALEQLVEVNKKGLEEARNGREEDRKEREKDREDNKKWGLRNLALACIAILFAIIGIAISIVH